MRRRYHRYFQPRWSSAVLMLAAAALGCASLRGPSRAAEQAARLPRPSATPSPAMPPGPVGSVEISYAHADDYLESLSVMKYSGARAILTKRRNGKTFTEVRFQGGQPVWEIRNQSGPGGSILGHLPGAGKARDGALKSVSYGRTPPNFVQEAPDYGSPEPLEANKYYVFSVVRGSGALSFQAVKVGSDGSIEAYDAEPRAGTSYELCCDLPADFIAASDSQSEEPSQPPDSRSEEPSEPPL